MSQKNSDQLILLDSSSIAARVALLVAVLLAVVGAFFGVRWQIGRMLADTASPTDKNFAQIARLAASFAPRDPQTLWAVASAERAGFSSDAARRAEAVLENTIRLSPNDYRYWLDLARTRDQAGATSDAEAAFRKALELAPNNAFARWLYGNFLLRAGERERAFTEFQRVAETHSSLRQQVFYLAWENIGANPAQIEAVVGSSPQVRAGLAPFYAVKGKPNDSVRIWRTLTPEQKEEFRIDGESAARTLYEKQNFRAAIVMLRELGVEAPEIGQIQNPSFEGEITNSSEDFVGWRTQRTKGIDIALDAGQRKEGKRSLRLTFSGFSAPSLQVATQYAAVESGGRYRLTFWVKTAELKSAGPPFLEIVDARTTKPFGSSKPFGGDAAGDWQMQSIEFNVPPETEAILIRTVRQFCGENCPITGVVWYDDFKLERLGKAEK
ncbi:MAG: hypothetical protein M3209_05450 [Acidobacteriota bacterium]|nr:hypothetical protein [Acidobacteriota bacterium]